MLVAASDESISKGLTGVLAAYADADASALEEERVRAVVRWC
jgi:hypothetical protein